MKVDEAVVYQTGLPSLILYVDLIHGPRTAFEKNARVLGVSRLI